LDAGAWYSSTFASEAVPNLAAISLLEGCARLLKNARLKYPQAAIEDLDSRSSRGLERSTVMSLALGEWVTSGHAC